MGGGVQLAAYENAGLMAETIPWQSPRSERWQGHVDRKERKPEDVQETSIYDEDSNPRSGSQRQADQ